MIQMTFILIRLIHVLDFVRDVPGAVFDVEDPKFVLVDSVGEKFVKMLS